MLTTKQLQILNLFNCDPFTEKLIDDAIQVQGLPITNKTVAYGQLSKISFELFIVL